MGLTEQMIQKKILDISNSYLAFTGKNEVWRNCLTLSEYQELRAQAIGELERGIAFEETEQKSVREDREEKKTVREDSQRLHKEQQKQVITESPPPAIPVEETEPALKAETTSVNTDFVPSAETAGESNIILYPDHVQEKNESVMDKFARLKDL